MLRVIEEYINLCYGVVSDPSIKDKDPFMVFVLLVACMVVGGVCFSFLVYLLDFVTDLCKVLKFIVRRFPTIAWLIIINIFIPIMLYQMGHWQIGLLVLFAGLWGAWRLFTPNLAGKDKEKLVFALYFVHMFIILVLLFVLIVEHTWRRQAKIDFLHYQDQWLAENDRCIRDLHAKESELHAKESELLHWYTQYQQAPISFHLSMNLKFLRNMTGWY